jgi:hypothetical protein
MNEMGRKSITFKQIQDKTNKDISGRLLSGESLGVRLFDKMLSPLFSLAFGLL